MHTSPGSPLSVQLLTAVSDDESLSPWMDVRGYPSLVFYCTSTGTTSSGVISFEEAAPSASLGPLSHVTDVFGATTGNYSVITTANASSFTGGAQLAVHPARAAYCFVRARVSTAIGGGGTISVGLVAY